MLRVFGGVPSGDLLYSLTQGNRVYCSVITTPMTKYFRASRKFRTRRVRWNVENQLLFSQMQGSTQVSAEIIKHGIDNRSGPRTIMTVKNFRISASLLSSSGTLPGVVWALVYVPSTQ